MKPSDTELMICETCGSSNLSRELIDCHPYIAIVICEDCGEQYGEQGRIRTRDGNITYDWYKIPLSERRKYTTNCCACGKEFRFNNNLSFTHRIRDIDDGYACNDCYDEEHKKEVERYKVYLDKHPEIRDRFKGGWTI